MMTPVSELKDLFGQWIAAVAGAVDTVAGRFLRPRRSGGAKAHEH